MSKYETKTISLSLNFNDENQYRFSVEIPLKTYPDTAWNLTGVNSDGEVFELGALGKPLMQLLVQLGHATKKSRKDCFEPGYWRIHAPRKKRQLAAMHAEVSLVKEGEPSAQDSVPAAGAALPNVNVIQGNFSPKAK